MDKILRMYGGKMEQVILAGCSGITYCVFSYAITQFISGMLLICCMHYKYSPTKKIFISIRSTVHVYH